MLVTGVAGFIGSNLADRLLAEGYPVLGVDDLSSGVPEQVPAGVGFEHADVRSAAILPLLRGVDTVFHLAARNCISDCQADPVATAANNVLGTVTVLEAARRAGVRKVVFAESSAVYEGSTRLPTPESEEAPESFYAVSKQAGRRFAEAYMRFHGLTLTTLRYFCVYGPRQDYRRTIPPVMSAFLLKLLRGERPTIYGSGEKRRDFVYVDDVNDFHLRTLTDARTDGRVFNVGSGESHSVREIFQLVRALVGSTLEPVYAPDLPAEAFETRADIGRARTLGWAPRVNLEEGLRRSLAYVRAQVLPALAASGAGERGGAGETGGGRAESWISA